MPYTGKASLANISSRHSAPHVEGERLRWRERGRASQQKLLAPRVFKKNKKKLTSESDAAGRVHSIHLTRALPLKDFKEMIHGAEFGLPLPLALIPSEGFTRIEPGHRHK